MTDITSTPHVILYTPQCVRLSRYVAAFLSCAIASACGPGSLGDDLETLETGDSETGAPTFPEGGLPDFGGVPDCGGDAGDGDGDPAGDGDGDGDPGTTGDGDGDDPGTTGDGDGDNGCSSEFPVECEPGGPCWTKLAAWSNWAEYAEPNNLWLALNNGVIAPSLDDLGLDATCYDRLGTPDHLCVIWLDCVQLLGVPANELNIVPSACAPDGTWTVMEDANDPGMCWGVNGGVAVRLDPDH